MKKLILAALAAMFISPAFADCVLKQSTASQVLQLPRFVDSTDGVTPETGLTIANTDIKIGKPGATTQANKNSGGATHIATGDYYITLDATDTNTVGNMHIVIAPSGALPVWVDCLVVEEAVYDAFYGASALGYVANAPVNVAQFGGSNGTFASGRPEVNASHVGGSAISQSSGVLNVNVAQVSTDSTAADTFETWLDGTAGAASPLGIVDQGTAQSATGTTLVLRSALAMADDTAIGMTLVACGSTQGYCQARAVTDYTSSSDTATVDTWTVTPSGTITYYLFGTAPSTGSGSGLDAAGVRSAIGLASANLDTQLSTIDDFVDTEVAAIKTKTDFLPSATAGSTGGVFIAGTNAATTVTTALTTTFTGNLTGSVGSVTGAVGSVTGAVGSVTGNVGGNVTGSVGSVATGGITAASVAADAFGASELAADAATEIGTAVLAAQGILTGTCSSGSTTTCVDAARTEADATQLQDRLICFNDGWCAMLTTFNPATDTATTTKTAPSTRASKTYTIFPSTAQ